MDVILKYNLEQNETNMLIANLLKEEIDRCLIQAEVKMYHALPVWFIDGNALVGYRGNAKGVKLIFWNGQEFGDPGLVATGKFHAAQIVYSSIEQIDKSDLNRWLQKSAELIWDYKGMRRDCALAEKLINKK